MNFTKARAGALVGLLGLATTGTFVACGGDDTTPNNPTDAGKDTNVADNVVPPVDSQPPVDTGTDSGTTLYQRLGGHDGIKAFITAVVTQLLKDPSEASYFVLQFSAGGPTAPTWSGPPYPGHPTAAQIIECFTDLAGSATGGPETYPAKTPDGYQCRAMDVTHAMYKINNGIFDNFVATAAAVATASGKVAPKDIAQVGTLLGTQRALIVSPEAGADGSPFDYSTYIDAADPRFSDSGDAGTDG